MLFRIVWVGLLAGIFAGLATAALQHVTTTPLIIAAEAYENKGTSEVHSSSLDSHVTIGGASLIRVAGEAATHSEDAEAWMPADGLQRTLVTSFSTVVTAVGYALMLVAAMVVAGGVITPRAGLAFGVAAFVATGLAPGLGLSPELPGAAAADLVARQSWWAFTAVSTAGGLWLLLRVSLPWAIAAGIALICLPHIVGAPHPGALTSAVPSELAAHFASTSLALHAVTWSLVGVAVGFLWQREELRAVA